MLCHAPQYFVLCYACCAVNPGPAELCDALCSLCCARKAERTFNGRFNARTHACGLHSCQKRYRIQAEKFLAQLHDMLNGVSATAAAAHIATRFKKLSAVVSTNTNISLPVKLVVSVSREH